MYDRATFVGGLRWPAGARTLGGDVTLPFVRLRVDGDGVHLAPNGLMDRFVGRFVLLPSYDFVWPDIQRVERLRRGVRFFTASLEAPVIFWASDPDTILDAIAVHTAVVDRQPQPVYGRPRLSRQGLTRRKLVGIALAIFTVVVANVLWAVAGLSAAVVAPLRMLILVVCILYVLAVVLIPDGYWTRGR